LSGCAAVLFLHSVPGGNDIALEVTCVLAGPAASAVRTPAGIGA
jgi:hypothetical protein